MLKIGFGYDIHRLEEGRRLYIGGVEIPADCGAIAHSDGDVLIHSLIDSLLSPVGAGDIGALFPDTDNKWKGISSLELLKIASEGDKFKNVKIINIDCTVILDRVKILPFTQDMKKIISRVLGIQADQIGIKGKTSENTKLFSIECYTVALLDI